MAGSQAGQPEHRAFKTLRTRAFAHTAGAPRTAVDHPENGACRGLRSPDVRGPRNFFREQSGITVELAIVLLIAVALVPLAVTGLVCIVGIKFGAFRGVKIAAYSVGDTWWESGMAKVEPVLSSKDISVGYSPIDERDLLAGVDIRNFVLQVGDINRKSLGLMRPMLDPCRPKLERRSGRREAEQLHAYLIISHVKFGIGSFCSQFYAAIYPQIYGYAFSDIDSLQAIGRRIPEAWFHKASVHEFTIRSIDPRHSDQGAFLKSKLVFKTCQLLLRKFALFISVYPGAMITTHSNRIRGYQFLQLPVSSEGVPDCSQDTNGFDCAFKYRPYPFWFCLLGFVLYGYGYVSAKIGHGNWLSLVTFFVGLPMCAYGIFKIIETVAEVRKAIV